MFSSPFLGPEHIHVFFVFLHVFAVESVQKGFLYSRHCSQDVSKVSRF